MMLDPGEIDPLYGVGEERHLVVMAKPFDKLRRNAWRARMLIHITSD